MAKFKFESVKFEQIMKDYATIREVTIPDAVMLNARLLCVELARRTQPFGENSTAGTIRVKNDIGKIIGFTCTTTTTTTDILMRSQTLLSNNNNVIFDNQFSFDGYGSPCTSLICTEYLICAAYATGHLRLFRFDIKELVRIFIYMMSCCYLFCC